VVGWLGGWAGWAGWGGVGGGEEKNYQDGNVFPHPTRTAATLLKYIATFMCQPNVASLMAC
jgi:hypothetical protein